MQEKTKKISAIFFLLAFSGCSAVDCPSTVDKKALEAALQNHQTINLELKDALGSAKATDAIAEYLKQSRTRGYAQTLKAKRKIDDLRKNAIRILTLVETNSASLKEPENPSLITLRRSLAETVARIDQLNEIYMLGGELAMPSYSFPDDSVDVLSRLSCARR